MPGILGRGERHLPGPTPSAHERNRLFQYHRLEVVPRGNIDGVARLRCRARTRDGLALLHASREDGVLRGITECAARERGDLPVREPDSQGLTLVPISAQLQLTLPLSAQVKLTLSPI
jgi:hypothetical protein